MIDSQKQVFLPTIIIIDDFYLELPYYLRDSLGHLLEYVLIKVVSTKFDMSNITFVFGDNINVMLPAAGYNFNQLLRKLRHFLLDFLCRVFVGDAGQTSLEMVFKDRLLKITTVWLFEN